MNTLAELDKPARALADAHDLVAQIVTDLKEATDALHRDAMPRLKAAMRKAAEKHDALKALIEENPQHFEKPKSITIHGIRLGYRKGVGGLQFEDPDQVVKLIRKHFPEQLDLLVETKEKPLKTPLAQLSAAELKKLGVTVEDTSDVAFIKFTDGDVDKLVKALLKSAIDEREGA